MARVLARNPTPIGRWSRLVAAQLLFTVAVGAAVGGVSLAYNQMVRREAHEQMVDTAELASVFLRQEIAQNGEVLSRLGEDPALVRALERPGRAGAQATLDRAVRGMLLSDTVVKSAAILDVDGTVRASSDHVLPIGFDAHTVSWFQEAVAHPATAGLSPVFESVTAPGTPVVALSVAVRSGYRTVGVLSVEQDLTWYEGLVSGYGHAQRVNLAVVDQTGGVVADGGNRVLETASLPRRAQVGRLLLGEPDGMIRAVSAADTNGSPAQRWQVVSEIPEAIVMRPARLFDLVAGILGLAVVLGVNLLLWLRHRERRERDRATRRIEESTRRLREIADTSADMLFRMEVDGTVRLASRASETLLGVTPEALAGTDLVSRLEVPGEVDLRQLLAEVDRTDEPLSIEVRSGELGRRRILELEVRAGLPGRGGRLIGLLRDVTERRSAQDQVEQLFQLTEQFMAVIDFEGRLVQINPVWESLLQRSSRELIGRSWFEFFRFDDPGRVAAEFARKSRDGTVLAVENRFVPLDAPDNARSLLWTMAADLDRRLVYAVGHDITRHKDLEAALAAARDEAVAASRMKSDFVATMSHEIRTPMNGVIGLTDLLNGTPLDSTQKRYVAGVRAAGEALLSVINDILDFSKIEAGRMQLEQVDFAPREVLDEVLTLVSQSASEKGLELELLVDPGVPQVVNGDPGRLRQLLLNLAHNAVKFTAEGGITLRAMPGRAGPGNRFPITLDVIDSGIGIDADRLEHIFEPFAQADAGTNRAFGGTGLGLSICRRLAELMSGVLTVASAPGEGTTFSAALVFDPPSDEIVTAGTDSRSLTVLIVDPSAEGRDATSRQLADWNMRPIAVSSADEAVMALAWAGPAFGAIDLAIVFLPSPRRAAPGEAPDESGPLLVRQLRTVEGLGAVPFVVVAEPDRQEWLETHRERLGITAVLTRPVQPSAVFDALTRVTVPVPVDVLPRVDQKRELEPRDDVRILLVEDNEINRMVALGMLGRLGYHVDVAEDGLEALHEAARMQFDVILMDCQMPRLDGYATTRALRSQSKNQPNRHTPIVAMTAATMEEDRRRCEEAGMNDFIAKPIRFQALQEALTRWLPDERRTDTDGVTDVDVLEDVVDDWGLDDEPRATAVPAPAPVREVPGPRPAAEIVPAAPADGADGAVTIEENLLGVTTDELFDELRERMSELLGGASAAEQDLVRDIADSFVARAPQLALDVAAAVAGGDAPTVALHAHALAGAALNVGALTIARAARAIENQARTGEVEPLPALVLHLEPAVIRDLLALAEITQGMLTT
ncbi:response regulator [Spongisporangium articulatum]|uniref:histidine kinase n=1 Tax=Spongisporangium articulatum TaxID=3362603 RepID=A0ABW8ARM2_9ACTN